MPLRISLLLAVLCLPAGVALAQWGGRGGVSVETPLLQRFDRNRDGMLNAEERRAALREFGYQASEPGVSAVVPTAAAAAAATAAARGAGGEHLHKAGNESLYDTGVLRTLYLEFDSPDWESELTIFKGSDVKVPAQMTVDGKSFKNVGISFHGASSYMRTSNGQKRSLSIDLNEFVPTQQLLGHKKLLLLNSANDATFMRSVLYMKVAREWYAAPQANFVRVVINGSNWGIYVNQQPVDAVFAKQAGGAPGPVWKAPGSPGGRAGLEYWGESAASYQASFELRTKGAAASDAAAWQLLVRLCRVLNETPISKLPAAIEPLLDVDNALRFLAIDNLLINSDAYYTRASDYNLYVDAKGRFRFAPHDANESMTRSGGGWRGGFGGFVGDSAGTPVSPVGLDPLAGSSDEGKPLLSRLLAVPEYRTRYLSLVRSMAEKSLDWSTLAATVRNYQQLLAVEVERDQRKLGSTAAFQSGVFNAGTASATTGAAVSPLAAAANTPGGTMRGGRTMTLEDFFTQRRAFLLAAIPGGT